MRPGAVAVVLLIVLSVTACSGEGEPTPLPGCESAPRPIVFVHGFMGGGDSFANAVMRFSSNGYCPEYLRAFDWNTLSLDMDGNVQALADFVESVLQDTGADQVDLVGHSMGGWLSYQYLSDEKRAAQVAHYVHAASFCQLDTLDSISLLAFLGGREIEFPDTVPLLVLSSDEDTVVGPCTIEGADNQDIDGADHLQMVTLPEVFAATYRFFNDNQAPTTTDITPEESVTLAGKVLTFGTNQPIVDAVVQVHALDAATGERLGTTPPARFSVGEDGTWGPFQADSSAYYEFTVLEEGERPFHYYRQPFSRSNPLVYLRTMPESNPMLDLVLGNIRYDDESTNIVFFSSNQALYYGRDTATLDGMDLVTPEMAPPPPDRTSTIAIFIFDADGDGQTDGGPVPIEMSGLSFLPRRDDAAASGQDPGQAAEFPFLRHYDAFVDTSTRRTVTLTLNGATLRVPTWKADSEGVVIAVFD